MYVVQIQVWTFIKQQKNIYSTHSRGYQHCRGYIRTYIVLTPNSIKPWRHSLSESTGWDLPLTPLEAAHSQLTTLVTHLGSTHLSGFGIGHLLRMYLPTHLLHNKHFKHHWFTVEQPLVDLPVVCQSSIYTVVGIGSAGMSIPTNEIQHRAFQMYSVYTVHLFITSLLRM